MATLHVRNVPDDLYNKIQRRASAGRRSISAEVVTLLEEALRRQLEPEAELFARIDRRRQRLLDAVGLFPSSVDLIREDRDR